MINCCKFQICINNNEALGKKNWCLGDIEKIRTYVIAWVACDDFPILIRDCFLTGRKGLFTTKWCPVSWDSLFKSLMQLTGEIKTNTIKPMRYVLRSYLFHRWPSTMCKELTVYRSHTSRNNLNKNTNILPRKWNLDREFSYVIFGAKPLSRPMLGHCQLDP